MVSEQMTFAQICLPANGDSSSVNLALDVASIAKSLNFNLLTKLDETNYIHLLDCSSLFSNQRSWLDTLDY
ncbi:hypothetical protein Syun_030545 [Stephania yunnanensis]|uniref:Uncharacterized protein n=1 Tax=Stephania yunnanensis TaxID=152371 RepID=A0AAP0DYT8_9MAGN